MVWITDQKEHEAIVQEIENSSDRTAAIVACAFLEERLKERLKVLLREGSTTDNLLGENGFLGTLFNKNAMAYALRIYDKATLKNIIVIGRVRNTFAHRLTMNSFKSDPIRKLCLELKSDLPSLMVTFLRAGDELPVPEPREHFIHVVKRILMDLNWSGPDRAPLYIHNPRRHKDEKSG